MVLYSHLFSSMPISMIWQISSNSISVKIYVLERTKRVELVCSYREWQTRYKGFSCFRATIVAVPQYFSDENIIHMLSMIEKRFFLCTHPKKVPARYARWRNFFWIRTEKKPFFNHLMHMNIIFLYEKWIFGVFSRSRKKLSYWTTVQNIFSLIFRY